MLIRKPQSQDIGAMVDLAQKMHVESVYHEFDFDRTKVAAIGVRILKDPNYFGRVTEYEDKIIGQMICFVSPYYFGNDLIATDMILYVDESRRGGVAAMRMIEEYVEWATEKGCKEALLGQTAGISAELVEKLYTRAGFKLVGQLYKRRLV